MQSARALVPILLASTLLACGGGKSAEPARLAETEPNDSSGIATEVIRNWSTIHLAGACDSANDQDWWAITFATFVPPAPVQATLSWAGAADLDLTMTDAFGAPLSTDPSASPAVVSSLLTTSGSFLLQVKCNAAAGTPWKLDIPAPGANPADA